VSNPAEVPPHVAISGRSPEVQEVALTLFSERGYHGTTMRQVAARMGVQAPSLYNHVASKQAILQGIVTVGMGRLIAGQAQALASTDDAVAQLYAMTRAHVLTHVHYPRYALVGDRELANLQEPTQAWALSQRETYERRFRANIARGVQERRFSVETIKLASFAIIEMATSVVVWFREGGALSAEQLADAYGGMALRIVGVDARIPLGGDPVG
jgi:AcrR family transcriptional regulator